MKHLDEGQLLALRDAAGVTDGDIHHHLDHCQACRSALEDVEGRSVRISGALGVLDEPVGSLDEARERVRQRVAAESARRAGAASLTARRARRTAWSASKAAGILLVTAAGLSALPGSPVRRWVSQVMDPETPTAEVAPLAAPTAASAPEEVGIRLPLSDGPLSVILRDAAPGTEIRVRWVPGREAAVFAPVGSRFTSGEGRMEARDVSGVVRVELPRTGVPVSLEVNGRILLRSSATGLEILGPVADRSDAGVTFRLPTP